MATVKEFQGKDRRMVTKMKNLMDAIQDRDVLALDLTQRTQALSTRTRVFDLTDAPTLAALVLIRARLVDVLNATKIT